jgi:spore germination protein KC
MIPTKIRLVKTKMKNKSILISVMVVITISLTGCWDSIELNERNFISAIGVDKGDDNGKITVTYQSVVPEGMPTASKSGGEEKPVEAISVSAYSMHEALTKYSQRVDKRPNFQQNRAIIIGEDAAREGVARFLNDIHRNPEYNPRAIVVVCKGMASDIIMRQDKGKKISSFYLTQLIESSSTISNVPKVDIGTFMMRLANKVTSPVATQIEVVKDKSDIINNIGYNGSAVFKKDRLAGWLNMHETSGLMWITNNFKNGIIVSGHQDEVRRNISLQLINSKTKIEPELKDGKITIFIDIKGEGQLRDNDGTTGLDTPEGIKSFESRFEAEVKNEVEACLKKVQNEYKTDVLGFGNRIHQKYPREWKSIEGNWEYIYPDIKVEINVKLKLKRIGLFINSINP